MAEANNLPPSFHIETAAAERPLYIQPDTTSASSDDENLSRTSSMSAPENFTMTTMSGSIVTTVSSQSRRHSSVLPFHAVSPSRRQSLNTDLMLPTLPSSYLSVNSATNAVMSDRLQTMHQQILSLQVSLRCLEEQNKESYRRMEQQNEQSVLTERRITESQDMIQRISNEREQTVQLQRDSLRMGLVFVMVAIFSFLLGRLL